MSKMLVHEHVMYCRTRTFGGREHSGSVVECVTRDIVLKIKNDNNNIKITLFTLQLAGDLVVDVFCSAVPL